ncbi:MAG: hypothetical protein Q7U35_01605 [Methanobacteriaceae archaeon]|jgi:hypothetical protein|nr:hypothetical protein [Methanobacteriaceae archaeon]MDO9043984.1 hypothetical protein [Methanobacteriaceae archaeon]MDO9627196.1 hypothetical protein [Methanobacteriaceae archaeon]MDP2836300.1 hypothetical protein [Methanobacteriaceae archaeon]MDP3033723.1 hypothetical protein [Methanobacteriaceae archaeon]
MNALLLRVDFDKGNGGFLAPIFDDGSFEYIPCLNFMRIQLKIKIFLIPWGEKISSTDLNKSKDNLKKLISIN